MRDILRAAHPRPARARRRVAARPPRLLQPRAERRLRRRRSSGGPASSSRPTRRCRARSGATRSTSARSSGWIEADHPLVEVPPPPRRATSTSASPRFVAERIPDGATLQTGIGAIPNAILAALGDHRDLGVHTELISDGVMDLVERGRRHRRRQAAQPHQDGRHVRPRHPAALRLPRREHGVRAVAGALRQRSAGHRPGGALRVDQRHARGRPARPVRLRDDRRAPTTRRAAGRPTSPAARCTPTAARVSSCCTRRPSDGTISKIVPQLAAGDVVTTLKNTVDKVVTEWGVAELRGRSIARARPRR